MNVIILCMGLYTKQEVENTELQKRIAESLNDKAKKAREVKENADLVDDSVYIEGTKKTTSLAWVWITLLIVGFGILFWLMATGLEFEKTLGV